MRQEMGSPEVRGQIKHDFRRSAAARNVEARSTVDEFMEVTGHATAAMFKRYADLSVRTNGERRSGKYRNGDACGGGVIN